MPVSPLTTGIWRCSLPHRRKLDAKRCSRTRRPARTSKQPALTRCLKTFQPGDTLIVWKLDRLGRSLRDIIHILDCFKQQGVKFRSLTEAIDTGIPAGRAACRDKEKGPREWTRRGRRWWVQGLSSPLAQMRRSPQRDWQE